MPESRLNRCYGWKPSPYDSRDYYVGRYSHLDNVAVLPEVDPRGDPCMPVIYDQGQLGSCTANAAGRALQYNLGLLLGKRARRPSRLDIYYGERLLEGAPANQDTGAYGRDALKFAQQTGYLLERDWPYDISTFAGPPPAGTRTKLTQPYARLSSTDALMQALSNKQFVIFGFTAFPSFEDQSVLDSGRVPYPTRADLLNGSLGGHEMCIVGYLASQPGYALVANSWGTDLYSGVPGADIYGGGYLLFPWSYLRSVYASDFRTIIRVAP